MVVISNRRLGPQAELVVSEAIAAALLRRLAAGAAPVARSRWELELVRWLELRAVSLAPVIDVDDIAWTPEHFEAQRGFALAAAATPPSRRPARGGARALAAHDRGTSRGLGPAQRRWQWGAAAMHSPDVSSDSTGSCRASAGAFDS